MATPVIGVVRKLAIDVADSETEAGENWQKLPMQSGATMTRATAKADTTNKDDAGFTSEVVVTKSWSISGDGQDTPHNIGLRVLAQKWESTTNIDAKVHIRAALETGELFVGWASLDNFDVSFPVTEAATYSVAFTGRGPLFRR